MKLHFITIGFLILITFCLIMMAFKDLSNKLDRTSKVQELYMRDYQMETTGDSIIIYDNARRVGAVKYDASKISNMIIDDNE